MTLDTTDRRLIAALVEGLPLEDRPYRALARDLGLGEAETIARTARLVEDGVIKRLGLVVRHRELGYRANAMVVWDVPDDLVGETGRLLARNDAVTLCYRRERRTGWPYNLYIMIHGRDRDAVLNEVANVARAAGLDDCPRQVLFSTRRFKQTGARYLPEAVVA